MPPVADEAAHHQPPERWINCRAIMAPPAVLDYVIAHELAHLRVRKHSPEYWAIVAQAVPDYRTRRERLRASGAMFDIR